MHDLKVNILKNSKNQPVKKSDFVIFSMKVTCYAKS